MKLIRLSFASFLLIQRLPFSRLPSAMSRQPSRRRSYANINTRFAHPLCAYRNPVTRLKQFAFAMCKMARAWLRCRVTRSSLALMPMASARYTLHFRSNNLSRVRKFLRVPVVTPWTWCLNKRCTVDPSDPKKAICVCDVLRTGEWITLGGNCDTGTCTTGYWSGATVKDFNEATSFMVKALSLDHSPVEWCPGANR